MYDVRCTVDVIVGTGRVTVRECLRLDRNSVVRLSQLAGSDLEIRVHGLPVAHGEVVIIDDQMALRVSRVTPPAGVDAA
jgi:flagellar motor switch protein FliN/FliY